MSGHRYFTIAIDNPIKHLEHDAHAPVSCDTGGKAHVPSTPFDEEYWLERAREAYAQAEHMVHPEAMRLMLEIAAGYQRLAQATYERNRRSKPRSS